MKKKFLFLICSVFFSTLVGCNQSEEDDKTTLKSSEITTGITTELTEITSEKTTEQRITETEVTKEEPVSDYTTIDYAVFAKYLAYVKTSDGLETRDTGSIQGCELADSDQDGNPELYVNKTYKDYYKISYVVSSYKKPGICINANTGAAGDSELMYSNAEGIPYFQSSYSTAAFVAMDYSTWSNNTFKSKGSYTKEVNSSDINSILVKETITWNNNSSENTYYEAQQASIYEDWYANVELLNLRSLNNNYFDITTVESSDDMAMACKGVEAHLDKLGISYVTASFDFDENGENEQVYVTRDYIQRWLSNINNIPDINDDVFCGMVPLGSVFIIVDSTDSGSTIYVDIRPEIENVKEINTDGLFTVIDQNDSSQIFTEFSPYDDCVLWYDSIYINNSDEAYNSVQFDNSGPRQDPFYGVFCYSSTDMESAEQVAQSMEEQGFYAKVVLTNNWSELNPEPYYAVTIGFHETLEDAEYVLQNVQKTYKDAYIKYSGYNLLGN